MDDNVRKADLLHEVKDLVLESVVCIFGDKDSSFEIEAIKGLLSKFFKPIKVKTSVSTFSNTDFHRYMFLSFL